MMRLLDILFPVRANELLLRGMSSDTFLTYLRPQTVPLTRPAAIGLLPFQEPCVRAAIHEAKYHGAQHARNLLALALADYLTGMEYSREMVRIIPIPLGTRRYRERGFNQVEAVAYQAGAGKMLDSGLMRRMRETKSQVSLPRIQREANMHGAFHVARALNPAYVYIILDDVLTTGATLQAAIDALQEAGARTIIPLALTH